MRVRSRRCSRRPAGGSAATGARRRCLWHQTGTSSGAPASGAAVRHAAQHDVGTHSSIVPPASALRALVDYLRGSGAEVLPAGTVQIALIIAEAVAAKPGGVSAPLCTVGVHSTISPTPRAARWISCRVSMRRSFVRCIPRNSTRQATSR